MLKEVWLEYRKQFYKMLFLFLLLFFATIMTWYLRQRTISKNNQKVESILDSIDKDKDISYVSMEQLEHMLETDSLRPSLKGRIYRLMAEISYLSDNKTDYNTYAAYAIYYFQKTDYSEQMMNLYSEYLGRLYENSGFDAAKTFLDQQNKDHPVSEYTDKQSTVSYYLSYADVEEMRGDYASAAEKLEQAKKYLAEITDQPHYERLSAKYQLMIARLALMQDKTDNALSILSTYHEDDTLGLPEGNIYVYCDFTLPYHELMGKVLLLQGKEKEAVKHIDVYLEGCNKSSFYMMQYRMLKYILTEHPDLLSDKNRKQYQKQFLQLSEHNIEYLSTQYCQGLLEHLEQAQNQLMVDEQRETNHNFIKYTVLFLVYGALILCTIIQYCLLYIRTDSLTRLTVRSQYERQRTALERRKIPYFLLILDIDDFKSVNDTYGHLVGDVVLRQIASIVKSQLNPKDHAFRYGGEEFCVILRENTLQDAFQVADSIRAEIHRFSWSTLVPEISGPLSISGGLAEAKHGKNPFQRADQALYYSKDHGKNQITSYPYPDAMDTPQTAKAGS